MNRPTSRGAHEDEDDLLEDDADVEEPANHFTREDLEIEEAEIRELERKKRDLSNRVTGMERDLGGLMR